MDNFADLGFLAVTEIEWGLIGKATVSNYSINPRFIINP